MTINKINVVVCTLHIKPTPWLLFNVSLLYKSGITFPHPETIISIYISSQVTITHL